MVRKNVKNHQAVAHATTTLEKIHLVRRGAKLEGRHQAFGCAYRLLDPDSQSPTVTRSGFRDFIHPSDDRLCTVRELARLQTFPDSYVFHGRRCDTYARSRYRVQTQHEQIGNAVPPVLARVIGLSVRRQIIEKRPQMNVQDTKKQFDRVYATLDRQYPTDRLGNKCNPLDELIFILLSRRAVEAQYVSAYLTLRRRYRRWSSLLNASFDEVASLIRPVGLANQRTEAILGSIEAIKEDFGTVSLAPLRRWSDSRVYHYLRTLPGVGDKTAKCVMAYSLNRNVLPIDSHTLRVSLRLGLVPHGTSYHRAPNLLDATVPSSKRLRFHVLCVLHGRATCRPRGPRCSSCQLREVCPIGSRSTSHTQG